MAIVIKEIHVKTTITRDGSQPQIDQSLIDKISRNVVRKVKSDLHFEKKRRRDR